MIERFRAWFSTEEVDEGLHFVLGAASLQDGVAVATAFFGVHGVGSEYGVEHVGGVDLGTIRTFFGVSIN